MSCIFIHCWWCFYYLYASLSPFTCDLKPFFLKIMPHVFKLSLTTMACNAICFLHVVDLNWTEKYVFRWTRVSLFDPESVLLQIPTFSMKCTQLSIKRSLIQEGGCECTPNKLLTMKLGGQHFSIPGLMVNIPWLMGKQSKLFSCFSKHSDVLTA